MSKASSLGPLNGFEASGLDRGHERVDVLLVLVRGARREVGDRLVERVAVAEVGGDRDWVSGSGVCPGQGPAAGCGRRR